MSRHRQRRRSGKAGRHAPPLVGRQRVLVREAEYVERLAYTRAQAAEALGVSRSTFVRRVLPYVETIEMPWGATLVPVDELERLLEEGRRAAAAESREPGRPGRRPAVSEEVVSRIREARAGGRSLAAIARELDRDGVPTAHGGRRWWPSTVRSVLFAASVRDPGRPVA